MDGAGQPKLVTLEGATKRDPLKDIMNCDLLLQDNSIIGIHWEGDCVIKISSWVILYINDSQKVCTMGSTIDLLGSMVRIEKKICSEHLFNKNWPQGYQKLY